MAAFSAVMLLGGGMALADQDEQGTEHRRVVVQGRQLVWKAPTEKPYALTGSPEARSEDRAEQDRPSFEHRGRSGSQYR
jgi:hypothetical protein